VDLKIALETELFSSYCEWGSRTYRHYHY